MAVPFPATMTIDQGTDCFFTVTYLQPNGTPVDLTGYTAQFAMREDYDEPVLFTLTQADYITLGGVAGTIAVHIPNANTGYTAGTYVAELQVATGGVKTSLLKGPLPLVTKVVS